MNFLMNCWNSNIFDNKAKENITLGYFSQIYDSHKHDLVINNDLLVLTSSELDEMCANTSSI